MKGNALRIIFFFTAIAAMLVQFPCARRWRIKADKLMLTFIVALGIVLMTGCLLWKPVPMGESDDYMLGTVAIERRGSLAIGEEDLEQAVSDFPEFEDYLTQEYKAGRQSQFADDNGRYIWYFATYPLICIPVKQMLHILQLPQIYAFALTNCLLYLLALLVVYRYLRMQNRFKWALLLLLGLNPIVFYLVWQSAELFLFSMTTMALVFWYNKEWKKAAILLSIAGSMNATVMVAGFFIISHYLTDMIRSNPEKKGVKLILNWQTIWFGCCFIPCLLPFAYYYCVLGVFSLQVDYGFSVIHAWAQRFIAYLIDWNFGFLPYFFGITIIAAPLALMCIIRKKYRGILFFLAFLGVVAAYSLMSHINCGMSGIARYNAWTAPILIFAVAIMIQDCIHRDMVSQFASVYLILCAFISGTIVYRYGFMMANNSGGDISITPIASEVLNHAPWLYWSLPSTFASRVNHIPGGYDYQPPVIYYNAEGYVKKALVTNASWSAFVDMCRFDNDDALESLLRYQRHGKDDSDPYFISISGNDAFRINGARVMKNTLVLSDDKLTAGELNTNGEATQDMISLSQYQVQYGPYIELPPDTYCIIIHGKHLKSVAAKITADAGETVIPGEMLEHSDEEIKIRFTLDHSTKNVEFVNQNMGEEVCIISEIIFSAQ